MKKIFTLSAILIALFCSHGSFATIYGSLNACIGATSALYDSSAAGITTSGIWSSSNTSVATIGSSTGVVTGISSGTAIITFVDFMGSTGTHTAVCTVSPMSPGSLDTLTGPGPSGTWLSVVCVGSSITIASTVGGGTWSSMSPAIATISSSGVVTGVSGGSIVITHTVSNSCGVTFATHIISSTSITGTGPITGITSVIVGDTATLNNPFTGGAWSSGSPAIATISSSGLVTGVSPGTAIITYTHTGCAGPASVYTTVTVTSSDCISGDVLFTGSPYYGPVKVWLIKYNPTTHMLTACDSVSLYSSYWTVPHFHFCTMGTDSFRIKAACDSAIPGSGYLPTYHTSSAYWNTATVINHVSGVYDMNKHITMGYGATTSGPGFIAGDVTTGANKGTADLPAVGLLIYCVNNTTGAIIKKTVTNSSGHYYFDNLPVDVPFKIYPELINYVTTPYPTITLTSSAPATMGASFVQHTLSQTITPVTTAISNAPIANAGIAIFPNPASGTLNIHWNAENVGTGTIVIADFTRREVLKSNVDMRQVSGDALISLDGISTGLYMVSIKGNGVNYNAKIAIK